MPQPNAPIMKAPSTSSGVCAAYKYKGIDATPRSAVIVVAPRRPSLPSDSRPHVAVPPIAPTLNATRYINGGRPASRKSVAYNVPIEDRKSTRPELQSRENLVCRLL